MSANTPPAPGPRGRVQPGHPSGGRRYRDQTTPRRNALGTACSSILRLLKPNARVLTTRLKRRPPSPGATGVRAAARPNVVPRVSVKRSDFKSSSLRAVEVDIFRRCTRDESVLGPESFRHARTSAGDRSDVVRRDVAMSARCGQRARRCTRNATMVLVGSRQVGEASTGPRGDSCISATLIQAGTRTSSYLSTNSTESLNESS